MVKSRDLTILAVLFVGLVLVILALVPREAGEAVEGWDGLLLAAGGLLSAGGCVAMVRRG